MLRFHINNMHSNSTFISICHPTMLFLLLCLFGSSYLEIIKPCTCTKDPSIVKCMKTEREALLTFKEGLTDPSGRLSSWVGDDCCKWRGVGCDNRTGHVFKLNLKNSFREGHQFDASKAYKQSCLGGEVNPSLLRLKYLKYLDLSLNDFRGIHIPKFLGSLHNLTYLNLSSASFFGEIPPHLGNLSHLCYLDLYGYSYPFFHGKLHVENLWWLLGLSSLKHLNMGSVYLGRVGADWLQAINMLPSLVELHLGDWCELQSLPLSLPFVNFTSLLVLDLSENLFNSLLPHWLFNLTSLTKLDLSYNFLSGSIPGEFANLMSLEDLDLSSNRNLQGQIPRFLGNLCKLKFLDLSESNFSGEINEIFGGFSDCPNTSLVSLDLSYTQLVGNLPDSLGRLENLRHLGLAENYFWGSIPTSIGSLSSLEELDLAYNKMNGTIPESIGQLSQLVSLFLYSNSWEGVLTEAHFLNLSRLETLWMDCSDQKSLSFDMRDGWIPPFNLKSIRLQNCQVGPKFPVWLQSQSELRGIVLRNVGISNTLPGDWISKISSHTTHLDLSNNQIKGKVPRSLRFSKATLIDFSSNFLEGPLPLWFSNLTRINLNQNLFSGPIPPNLGELMPRLKIFVVRDNNLSGALPDTWNDFQDIMILDLANNSFSGNIPKSLGNLHHLRVLILSDNHLEGELLSSLQNCKYLKSLDLGGNNLSGHIPLWIGDKLPLLEFFRLRSNLFSGELPPQLCHLSYLQILDLAQNNFTGIIPKCLGNLTALVYGNFTYLEYDEKMMVVAKGRELEYSTTLRFVNCIDLSQNHLMGGIPDQITSLSELGTLNLSLNHLTGSIPEDIGNLRLLETLDLSNNHLSGRIPQSMSSLTFLAHFNLSYNNLAGRIPSGNQLQTLNDSSIYEGNPLLCGVPLPTKCPGDDTSDGQTSTDGGIEDNDDEKDSKMLWFYVSIGPGFVVGFWGVCGTLLVKKTWRHAYFQFVDDIGGWIALMIALKVAALRLKMGLEHN